METIIKIGEIIVIVIVWIAAVYVWGFVKNRKG